MPSADFSLRKAGWLDTPLIFRLMLEGSVSGSFSDRYLWGSGHLKLFLWIVKNFAFLPRLHAAQSGNQTFLICQGDIEAGFIQTEQRTIADGKQVRCICLFAISKEHQNRGLGTWTVSAVIARLPPGTVLEAYCTKYARAMQHILTKLSFRRDKQMIGNLNRFSLTKD